jgi:hypothetical protein
MIAADDPLIGPLAAGHFSNYVVDRLDVPIERELQPNRRRFATEMICRRKSSAPAFGNNGSVQIFQQRQRVPV